MKTSTFIAATTVAAFGLSLSLATPSRAQTPAAAPAAAAQPSNELVYLPQLPNVADLTSGASSQGLTILKISQTATAVTVTYKYPAGQVSIVTYEVLPPGEGGAAPVAATVVQGTTAPTVVAAPPQTVVYQTTTPVYYDTYPAYYPWNYWYPPVSIGLGFAWGWHGGWHGGGAWHGGRGWHR
jgi:hypothetical protein